MKMLYFKVVALFVFLHSGAILSYCQICSPNFVGLYTLPDCYNGSHGTSASGVPVEVYLVLSNPTDDAGIPYSGITGFNCQITFNPPGNIFLTSEVLPSGGINYGDAENLGDGFLEYIVEYSAEVPVIEEAVILVSLQLIFSGIEPIAVSLGPTSSPRIPGERSYLPSGHPPEIMYPAPWWPEDVVFYFAHVAPPATEKSSFGRLKAMFR